MSSSTVTLAAGTLQCLPDPTRPDPGQEVRVQLSTGAPFRGKAISPGPSGIQRLWNGGRTRVPSGENGEPPGFRVEQPGVQLIAHEAGDGALVSYCKALVVVGDPEPGETIWRSELGQRLEIVPRTDPVLLAAGGGLFEAQILFDREPLVGVTVTAVSRKGGKRGYGQTFTNARGIVRFDLDVPGSWLVHLEHKTLTRGRNPGWELFESSIAVAAGSAD